MIRAAKWHAQGQVVSASSNSVVIHYPTWFCVSLLCLFILAAFSFWISFSGEGSILTLGFLALWFWLSVSKLNKNSLNFYMVMFFLCYACLTPYLAQITHGYKAYWAWLLRSLNEFHSWKQILRIQKRHQILLPLFFLCLLGLIPAWQHLVASCIYEPGKVLKISQEMIFEKRVCYEIESFEDIPGSFLPKLETGCITDIQV